MKVRHSQGDVVTLRNDAYQFIVQLPRHLGVDSLQTISCEAPILPSSWAVARFVRETPAWKDFLFMLFARRLPDHEWLTTFYRSGPNRGSNGEGLDLVFSEDRKRAWVEGG